MSQDEVRIAKSEEEILACFPVVSELRTHLSKEAFVDRVRLQEREGYRLAYLSGTSGPVAAAGFRILENLALGRVFYVDDLVTLDRERSRGHGRRLLAWLHARAQDAGCDAFELDSGTHRKDAHRFYEREGMSIVSYRFAKGARKTPKG